MKRFDIRHFFCAAKFAKANFARVAAFLGSIFLMSSWGSGVLSFRDFPDYRVFQRNVSLKSAVVEIAGVVGPGVDSLQACVVLETTREAVLPCKTLDISHSGFTDTLRVPQGGWYRMEYRVGLSSGGIQTFSSGKWGVGMNILCIGQSNMSGRGEAAYREASDLVGLYSNDMSWKHLADPYDAGGKTGQIDFDDRNPKYSMIPALTEELVRLGIPIGIVPAAKGSTRMSGNDTLCWRDCWSYRNEAYHRDPNSLYGTSLSKVDSVGGVELIILHQGEKDVGVGYANYKAAMEKMLANYRQDMFDSLRIFYCKLGSQTAQVDSNYAAIQRAQVDLADSTRNILAVTSDDLEVLQPDNVHFTSASLDIIGRRMARSILAFYGINIPYAGIRKDNGATAPLKRSSAYTALGQTLPKGRMILSDVVQLSSPRKIKRTH